MEKMAAEGKKMAAASLETMRALAKKGGLDLDAAMAKPPGGLAELHAQLVASKKSFEAMGAKVPALLEAEIAAVAPGGKVDAAVQKMKAFEASKLPKPPVSPEALKAAAARPGGLGPKDKNLAGAKLAGADLSGMDLSNAILKDADLSKAKLVKTNLKGAQLSKANLAGADLTEAVLEKADLTGAALAEAKLDGAILAQATQSNFFEASFEKADLSGADFNGSNLFGSEFLGSVLEGTKLQGANVRSTKLA